MSAPAAFTVRAGLDEAHRAEAAQLFWAAFRDKLGVTLGPEDRALAFVARVLRPRNAISAVGADGTLLGVAGFRSEHGALLGGDVDDLREVYGWLGALWRAPLLHAFERDERPGEMLMDGIFVRDTARGLGVGTALIEGICAEARRRGYEAVRLDVIDSNPRARALYERRGFRVVGEERLGPLRHVFGFRTSFRMVRPVLAQSA